MISLSKRKTMDDRKKQIAESIAEACASSFIGSTFPGCTISNLKVRVTLTGDESSVTYETNPSRLGPVRHTLIADEGSVSYKPNPSGPNQRKLEDGVKPPLGLTKEIAELEPEWKWKDVADARRNRFALWRAAWRNYWRDACW